jgi:hypothetical protein
MLKHQLGRSNLTPEQQSYLRGKQYHLEKNTSRGGGDHRSTDGDNQKAHNEPFENTAEKLAKQHNVGKETIKRDAAFAASVDTLAAAVGDDTRQTILARDTKISRQDVKALSAIATGRPQTAKDVVAAVLTAPTATATRKILQEAVKQLPTPRKRHNLRRSVHDAFLASFTPFERARYDGVMRHGWPTLANRTTEADARLIRWAQTADRYVRIDQGRWQSPFTTGSDGRRDYVLESYAAWYLPRKISLLARLSDLHGKVLGCTCLPEPCHGEALLRQINPEAWEKLDTWLRDNGQRSSP